MKTHVEYTLDGRAVVVTGERRARSLSRAWGYYHTQSDEAVVVLAWVDGAPGRRTMPAGEFSRRAKQTGRTLVRSSDNTYVPVVYCDACRRPARNGKSVCSDCAREMAL